MLVVVGNAAETEQNYSTVGIASVVATSVPFLLESTAKEDTVLYTCHPLCPVRRATRPRCVTMLILGSSPSDWIQYWLDTWTEYSLSHNAMHGTMLNGYR
jgi:hypothetical protein